MNVDTVVIGSAVTVVLCVVIVGYIGFKVKALINKDAKSHKE
ncbi:hypothetical protein [Sedimenticola hydrogenitrophicus]|nr:hypothetical protein [Sedimenticola hydrogenitrophicus]